MCAGSGGRTGIVWPAARVNIVNNTNFFLQTNQNFGNVQQLDRFLEVHQHIWLFMNM